jgi:hypothetical protein
MTGGRGGGRGPPCGGRIERRCGPGGIPVHAHHLRRRVARRANPPAPPSSSRGTATTRSTRSSSSRARPMDAGDQPAFTAPPRRRIPRPGDVPCAPPRPRCPSPDRTEFDRTRVARSSRIARPRWQGPVRAASSRQGLAPSPTIGPNFGGSSRGASRSSGGPGGRPSPARRALEKGIARRREARFPRLFHVVKNLFNNEKS